ncbi:MAG: FMN-binding protein [Betaproteobacteria bacterium]|nr:FMN-binding protein [Betaproteobacteria bacterium]
MASARHLWVPIAAACAPAPAHATQYLTVEQASRLLFPDAETFVAAPIGAQRAWAAMRGGVALGHVLVDEVIGKHELITYAVGIRADGSIRGVEILDYRETRGGEVRDPRWRAQFVGKKNGDPLRLEDDIQNISGATLSCRHVTEGVKRLLALHASSTGKR